MAQNKSWKELMELQGAAGGTSQQKANAMLELIEGREPFAYDAGADPAAQALRKETARNIGRTTQNTLGSYAGMTGGMPSSAAVTAAAQAGNYTAAQGADQVAELEQLARQNYESEGQQMKSYWSMLQGQADSEYNRQMQEQQLAEAREQEKYARELEMAKLAAMYGDYTKLKALGVDTSNMESGVYSTGGPVKQKEPKEPTGMSMEEYNDLLMTYGAILPEDVYAQLAAKYGEDTLAAKGFRRGQEQKKDEKPTSSGGSYGARGTRYPGITKGESDLGRLD